MELNWYILFITALIPLVVGFVWYNPKVFGNVWMRSAGVTQEQLNSGNMLVIFGLTYLFGFLISIFLFQTVIHQFAVFQVLEGMPGLGEAGSEVQNYMDNFMATYGSNHRGIPHGIIHGGVAAVFFVLPVIAIGALFERRGWKYIWVHFGYWFVTLIIMGAIMACCM